MEIAYTQTITVHLTLSAEEAAWLKRNVQNPMHGQTPDEEAKEDADMRRKLFNLLNELKD